MERIQINPMHMSLDAGKEFLTDVHNFGFVSLHVKDDAFVISSPSGHVLIFTKTGPAFQFPPEVRDILFQITDVRKVTLFRDSLKKFLDNNGMDRISNLVDLHPIAKRNVEEIAFGTLNYFKSQLGKDFLPRGPFDLNADEHVKQASHISRTVSYAVWFIAARFATRAGLRPQDNISSFLRYTLFNGDTNKYEGLIADPYYVPYDENQLTPLDQLTLEQETVRLQTALKASNKDYRFKPEQPFNPIAPESRCCLTCGVFVNRTKTHECKVVAGCKYPCCLDEKPHTSITCRYIKAWCKTCQHRGHVDRQHPGDQKFPVCYFWTLFLKFSRLNMDTSYVYKGEKCQNPYFHQLGLYGLPPSKVPKAAPESGVGQDLPNDPRYTRPASAKTPSPPNKAATTKRPSLPVKIDLTKLDRTKPGRVDKKSTVNLSLSDLTEAIRQAKRISLGEQPGTSGSGHVPNPVVSELLKLVDELKQGGLVPTAQEPTKRLDEEPPKLSRRQKKLADKALRAKAASDAADAADKAAETAGTLPMDSSVPSPPPPAPSTTTDRTRTQSQIEEDLLLASDEDTGTPVNPDDNRDLMEFDDGVLPHVVETLAETVSQVDLHGQGSGQPQARSDP
jgi:hypothetical protein